MEKFYSIAIRKRQSGDDRFFEHNDFMFNELKINCHNRYWLADPLLYETGGKTYLFYEAYDLVTRKGKIGYSIVSDDGTATSPKIIIDEDFHLSFPNIFEKDGNVYIMPESCGDSSIRLYRALKFPDVWERDRILAADTFSTDTVWLDETRFDTLLGSVQYRKPPEGKVISCWVKNTMFPLGPAGDSPTVVKEGDYGVRNAGKIFSFHGDAIRPGQICTGGKYGSGLAFWKIGPDLTEKEIYSIRAEEMEAHVRLCSGKKLVGTHTYNASQNYEVIDIAYFARLPRVTAVRKKIHGFLWRLYIKIFRRKR